PITDATPALTDPALLEAARLRRPRSGTAALVIVAGCVFGLALLIDTERARRVAAAVPASTVTPAATSSATSPGNELPPFAGGEPPPPEGYPSHTLVAPEPAAPPPLPVPHATNERIARERRQELDTARRGAEDVRFQAGLARIAAERLEGRQIAPG